MVAHRALEIEISMFERHVPAISQNFFVGGA